MKIRVIHDRMVLSCCMARMRFESGIRVARSLECSTQVREHNSALPRTVYTRYTQKRMMTIYYEGWSQSGRMGMRPGHALAIQFLPQLVRVDDWNGLSHAVFETSVQNLVARGGNRRGVILTAKGKEKSDHILRVAVLHVDHDLEIRHISF